MERSRTDLAGAVDALAAAGRAAVSETRAELALYQLDAAAAREIVALLPLAGFRLVRLADEGGDVPVDAIDDAYADLEMVAAKPEVPADVYPVLTRAAFLRMLDRDSEDTVVWVQDLPRPVETMQVAYRPWGGETDFVSEPLPGEPARVVRDLGDVRDLEGIGRWLLRDADADLSGRFLVGWRERAAKALSRALCQEVERDGRILFRGPPPTRFRMERAELVEIGSLADLQRAAAWVYGNPRELENRHGLLAAEVARTALRDGSLPDLGSVIGAALEGARIAYGFGVSQQSRDALKTLSDLRKAVADETSKLADATRAMAGAVMTSAVGNVGLVIARLTIAKGSTFVGVAACLVGAGLFVYVCVVVGSGWHYLSIQRDLRDDWRERLYRFLGNEEYERMVTTPVRRAENGFRNSAIGSLAIALVFLLAVVVVALR